MKTVYHYNHATRLYVGKSIVSRVAGYDSYIVPQFATLVVPPEFDDTVEQARFDLKSGTWVIEPKLIKVTAYLKSDCTKQKEFDDVTLVTDDYTLKKPATQFDEWSDDAWVTNISNQYIDEFNQVDNLRRSLYFAMVDPLVSEANIKRLQGKEAEAIELERQAIAAREKIQLDHPWPVNPEA
ncbi:TPA: phage tail protein [Vibrio cholerae]|nr:phage tail protein [Vibrio cholerae]